MACDLNNWAQIRTRHPDFIQLCKIIGIEIDKDCIENIVKQIKDKEDGIAPRLQGTITSAWEDYRYG